MPDTIGTTGLYASFTVFVTALLAVDFFMLKKQGSHTVSTRQDARILHRLRDREVAGGRQCLRLNHALQLLRGAGRAAETRAAVRRARRDRPFGV
jgi:hypothetical protein